MPVTECDCVHQQPLGELHSHSLHIYIYILHLALYGSSTMAVMNGPVLFHCLLNLVLYLKAPECFDLSPPAISLCRFGEPAVPSSLSESCSDAKAS